MNKHPSNRSWMARFRDGLKGFRMAWSGTGGGSGSGYPWAAGFPYGTLPGATYDYEAQAGDVTLNAVVSMCLGWLGDNIVQADLRVTRDIEDGVPDSVPGHPLVRLLERPNPFYDGDALWAATVMSYAAHGNAYWVKVRGAGGYGPVKELWYLPHWQVSPRWPADGSEFIRDYVYRVDGREIALPRRDVVHFRFGIDPENPRLGQSRLRAVLREIVTDNEASTFMAALLRNMGVPGVLICPSDAIGEMTAEATEELKRQFRMRYGGESRGEALVASRGLRLEKLGLTPEELVLESVRDVPESRICGALRLSPMVVGLRVGDQTRTFSNYEQARRAAYEDCLALMHRRFARALQRELLPELGDPDRERVEWDYSRVVALREDMSETYRRNTVAVGGGWMTVNEARTSAGLTVDPEGDRYLRNT